MGVAVAVAESAAATDTKTLAVAFTPFASVTVKRAVYEPACKYIWLGLWLVDVVPSPKLHENVIGARPPPAEPVNATVSGASPLVGLADAPALRVGETTTPAVALAVRAFASVTVSVAV